MNYQNVRISAVRENKLWELYFCLNI